MARLTIDYWRVETADAAAALEASLRDAASWAPNDRRRVMDHLGRVIRLRIVERDIRRLHGEFTGIAVNEGGFKGDRDGAWDPLRFKGGEGLGQAAAFVYSPTRRVLALQRNRNAASSSVVGRYFQESFPSLEELDLLPIPTQDALERFRRLRRATSVEIAISGGTGAIPDTTDQSVADLLRIQSRIGVPVLRAQLTVGHHWQKESAKMGALRDLVSGLLRGDGGTVEKLKITGMKEDDERDVIDFATDRIVDVLELKPDEGRDLSYHLRVATIREGLKAHSEDLRLE